ncbi:MAG: HNH endonuclease [Planctomycetes bacterium]|nr:HNH endonuclease [Planctomycetota bacterium]
MDAADLVERVTIAPTDFEWYRFLVQRPPRDEVNYWKPSADKRFLAEPFTPFLFKLKAPRNAIGGFGWFARYARLPDWLAWDCFGEGNGCWSLAAMRERLAGIRKRIDWRPTRHGDQIGCIVIVQPVFFAERDWIAQPNTWPARSLTPVTRTMEDPEWARVWAECRRLAAAARPEMVAEASPRFGAARLVQPRLGQGAFRVAVTDAYGRACAVTGEHSLPALDAAHIRAVADDGPYEVRNGILLRADLHRLFDVGYVTVDGEKRFRVSPRLRADFANGKSYYPLDGKPVSLPEAAAERPSDEFLAWHRERRFLG